MWTKFLRNCVTYLCVCVCARAEGGREIKSGREREFEEEGGWRVWGWGGEREKVCDGVLVFAQMCHIPVCTQGNMFMCECMHVYVCV